MKSTARPLAPDEQRAFEVRVQRELGTIPARGKSPRTPPAPKPNPPKPRPVKRTPAPQRKSRSVGTVTNSDGKRVQVIECGCGHTYRRDAVRGRLPNRCEVCR